MPDTATLADTATGRPKPASPLEIDDQLKRLLGVFRPPVTRTDPAYPTMIREYCVALQGVARAELEAAVTWTIGHRGERSWPLPADLLDVVQRSRAETADPGKGEWIGVPSVWRYDTRLIDLRHRCRAGTDGPAGDPLPALANALAKAGIGDPWLCMRSAMAERSKVWEVWEAKGKWYTGGADYILNARALVEKYARKIGVAVELIALPLDSEPEDAA